MEALPSKFDLIRGLNDDYVDRVNRRKKRVERKQNKRNAQIMDKVTGVIDSVRSGFHSSQDKDREESEQTSLAQI